MMGSGVRDQGSGRPRAVLSDLGCRLNAAPTCHSTTSLIAEDLSFLEGSFFLEKVVDTRPHLCTTAAFITARNRQIAVHHQWMARSYAVTFTFVSSRVLNLWPRYWSHLGNVFAAVGVIAFTLASLLIVDLGLNWHELTTTRRG